MRWVVALWLFGCGSSPAPATSPAPIAPPPDAAPVGVAIDAAVPLAPPIDEPRPTPTASLENIVVAGELDAAKVTELLAPLAGELGTCLGANGPTTTELSLTIKKSAIGFRNAWQGDAPIIAPCLRAIFPDEQQRTWDMKSTTVYVVVKAAPPGMVAPAAPALRERRDEFVRLYCDLEKLAGAEKLQVPDKQNRMIAWARDHIKHPAPLQLASDVPTWSPAEGAYKLEKAIRAEGIKKCDLQRW
jgi:hypothetical protein